MEDHVDFPPFFRSQVGRIVAFSYFGPVEDHADCQPFSHSQVHLIQAVRPNSFRQEIIAQCTGSRRYRIQ